MKIIIVYYSLEGNTDFVAQKIASELNADILRLSPKKVPSWARLLNLSRIHSMRRATT